MKAACSAPRARARAALIAVTPALAWALALAATLPLVAAAAAPSAAPAAQPRTHAAATGDPAEVKEAWIRWLPSGLPAGGYVTLFNPSDQPLVLLGASSEAYADIELHHSVSEGGMSRMMRVNRVTIPAHSTLSFATAGYHLMLMQPSEDVSPGEHVAMTLHYAGGRSQSVQFEVRKPDASGAPMPADMQGMGDMKGMQGMKSMPDNPH